MTQPKEIRGFELRFILLCGILLFPWPGWNQLYGQYFCAVASVAFPRVQDNRLVIFTPHTQTQGFSSLDTQIMLGNLAFMDRAGHGPAKLLGFDSRSEAWVPTALTMALILSTPIPWRRRVGALFFGLILIHCFILFCIQTWIWDESSELSLWAINPFWQTVLDSLVYNLITQIGISFFVPVLIWVFLCFRPTDWQQNPKRPGRAKT